MPRWRCAPRHAPIRAASPPRTGTIVGLRMRLNSSSAGVGLRSASASWTESRGRFRSVTRGARPASEGSAVVVGTRARSPSGAESPRVAGNTASRVGGHAGTERREDRSKRAPRRRHRQLRPRARGDPSGGLERLGNDAPRHARERDRRREPADQGPARTGSARRPAPDGRARRGLRARGPAIARKSLARPASRRPSFDPATGMPANPSSRANRHLAHSAPRARMPACRSPWPSNRTPESA